MARLLKSFPTPPQDQDSDVAFTSASIIAKPRPGPGSAVVVLPPVQHMDSSWNAELARLDEAEHAAERSLRRLHQLAATRLTPRLDSREGAPALLRAYLRHEHTPTATAAGDTGDGGAPALSGGWALRLEGRLVPPLPPACAVPTSSANGGGGGSGGGGGAVLRELLVEPKFSSFFEKVAVYLHVEPADPRQSTLHRPPVDISDRAAQAAFETFHAGRQQVRRSNTLSIRIALGSSIEWS